MLTYDRKRYKTDIDRIREANLRIRGSLER